MAPGARAGAAGRAAAAGTAAGEPGPGDPAAAAAAGEPPTPPPADADGRIRAGGGAGAGRGPVAAAAGQGPAGAAAGQGPAGAETAGPASATGGAPRATAGSGAAGGSGGEPDTRAALLATASAIMREGDIVDVSLSELAARSGLNSALVKYYFGNKAGLMTALLERDFADIVRAVDALLAKDMDPEAKFRQHLKAVVDVFFRTPYVHRLLMRLIREGDLRESARLADAYLLPLLGAYERLIGEGVAAGVFRPVDPLLFYFTVVGAADRFFSARLVLRHCTGSVVLDEALRDRYRKHLQEFVMAGILVKVSGLKG